MGNVFGNNTMPTKVPIAMTCNVAASPIGPIAGFRHQLCRSHGW